MIMRMLAVAALYFGLIFALGFVLGALRTGLLAAAPEVSRFHAVLVEAPIMLAASWFVCAFVIRRYLASSTLAARAGMGGGAFLLLALSELLLAMWLLGMTPMEHFRSFGEPSRALGLAAQIVFGLFPLIQPRGRMSIRT
ncbi:MAG: hypothetical protein ACKVS5_07230 [Parvularculaceae bacterium]